MSKKGHIFEIWDDVKKGNPLNPENRSADPMDQALRDINLQQVQRVKMNTLKEAELEQKLNIQQKEQQLASANPFLRQQQQVAEQPISPEMVKFMMQFPPQARQEAMEVYRSLKQQSPSAFPLAGNSDASLLPFIMGYMRNNPNAGGESPSQVAREMVSTFKDGFEVAKLNASGGQSSLGEALQVVNTVKEMVKETVRGPLESLQASTQNRSGIGEVLDLVKGLREAGIVSMGNQNKTAEMYQTEAQIELMKRENSLLMQDRQNSHMMDVYRFQAERQDGIQKLQIVSSMLNGRIGEIIGTVVTDVGGAARDRMRAGNTPQQQPRQQPPQQQFTPPPQPPQQPMYPPQNPYPSPPMPHVQEPMVRPPIIPPPQYQGQTSPLALPPEQVLQGTPYELGLKNLPYDLPEFAEPNVAQVTCDRCHQAFFVANDSSLVMCPWCGQMLRVGPASEHYRPEDQTHFDPRHADT